MFTVATDVLHNTQRKISYNGSYVQPTRETADFVMIGSVVKLLMHIVFIAQMRKLQSSSTLSYKFPWCSGYHIRLTRGRSPVRSRAETFFLNDA